MTRLPEVLACLTEAGDGSLAPEAWVEWWRIVTAPFAPDVRIENRVHVTAAGVSTAHVVNGAPIPRVATQKWAAGNPVEVWERLATAGILPFEAVGDPRRRFACSREACDCRGEATPPQPMALPDAVALASRWSEVLAVEALAQETCATLAITCGRFVWRVGSRREEYGANIPVVHVAPGGNLPSLSECLDVRGVWWPRENVGTREVAPAVEVWRLGFSIDRIADGTVTIICPPAGTP